MLIGGAAFPSTTQDIIPCSIWRVLVAVHSGRWFCLLYIVIRTKLDRIATFVALQHRSVLARTDLRHVVVLAESTQVLIQLLNLLLVRLDSIALESFFEPLAPHLIVSFLCFRFPSSASFLYALFGCIRRQRPTGGT